MTADSDTWESSYPVALSDPLYLVRMLSGESASKALNQG